MQTPVVPLFKRITIRAATPPPWYNSTTTTPFTSITPSSVFLFFVITFTLLALFFAPLAHFFFSRNALSKFYHALPKFHNALSTFRNALSKMQFLADQAFPFLELPPELREMVYEYLVEDPHYPPRAPSTSHSHLFKWFTLTTQKRLHAIKQAEKNRPKGSWILLANKQISAEFTNVVCKRATFHLRVTPTSDPKTIHDPTTTITPTSTPSLWKINPYTLNSIRKCDIQLVISSAMPGVPDPRNMKPNSWALAHQIRAELIHVRNIQQLTLHVEAIGNPLWNPLWVWYHACQSFKSMGDGGAVAAAPTAAEEKEVEEEKEKEKKKVVVGKEEPTGPKLNRITFSLEGWSPVENHLARDHDKGGSWAWWCVRGHHVGSDGDMVDVSVREFCAKLYKECRICRPKSTGG